MGNENSTFYNLMVFRPPILVKENIEFLEKEENVRLFKINNISVIEISPEIDVNIRKNKLVIYSHGIANDIYTEYFYLKYLCNVLKCKIVSYDYPFFGVSNGKINEENCYKALEDVINIYKNNGILLIGHSFGTGIVVNYISKHKWENAILLLAPFKSLYYVFFGKLLTNLINYEFDSYGKIKTCEIICKIKLVHCKGDKILSVSHSEDIYDMCIRKNLKVLDPHYIEGGDHSDFRKEIDEVYLEMINL